MAPKADQKKVKKRKIEMGHGSLHGTKREGYSRSPVPSEKKKLTSSLTEDGFTSLNSAPVATTDRRKTKGRKGAKRSSSRPSKPIDPEVYAADEIQIEFSNDHSKEELDISIPNFIWKNDSTDESFAAPLTDESLTEENLRSSRHVSHSTSRSRSRSAQPTSSAKSQRQHASNARRKREKPKNISLSPKRSQRSYRDERGQDSPGRMSSSAHARVSSRQSSRHLGQVNRGSSRSLGPSNRQSMASFSNSPYRSPIQRQRSAKFSEDKNDKILGSSNHSRGRLKSSSDHSRQFSSHKARQNSSRANAHSRRDPHAPMHNSWQNNRDSRRYGGSQIRNSKLAVVPDLNVSDDEEMRASSRISRKHHQSPSDHSRRDLYSMDSSTHSKHSTSLHGRRSTKSPVSDNSEDEERLRSIRHKGRRKKSVSSHSRRKAYVRDSSAILQRSSSLHDRGSNHRRQQQSLSNSAHSRLGSGKKTSQDPSRKPMQNIDGDDDEASFAVEDIEEQIAFREERHSREKNGKKPKATKQFHSNNASMNLSMKDAAKLKDRQRKKGGKLEFPKVEKKPPKTLVLIWTIVMIEIGFDFVTTIISFQRFAQGGTCCGFDMTLGRLPVAVTIPFFVLALFETVFLITAITLTLWPSITAKDSGKRKEVRSTWVRRFLCFITWNAKVVLHTLNTVRILNPFFGCVIAWMLLYQSDKSESFIVLGLEGASIIFHFLSVWLEGSCKSITTLCIHCIQLVPFLVSVILILLYLRQGGICYVVQEGQFLFSGCELCPDQSLPIDGICTLPDGTNITITSDRLWEIQGDLTDLAEVLTARPTQGTYCSADFPEGPQDEDFCFFFY